LLSDLGANVIDVPPGADADLVDLKSAGTASRVMLSPYGAHGRFADAPDHHAAVEAVGGALLAQYTYTPGPAYLVSPYSTVGQALLATAAVIAARLGDTSSRPQSISGLQGLFALQSGFYTFGSEPEVNRFSHSPRGQTPVYSTYMASDDWLFIGASTTPFMIKVLQALGLDELLDDPRVQEGARALREADLARELWERIDPIVRRHPREHWLRVFEELKVPAGPVLTLEETLAQPQIRAAGRRDAEAVRGAPRRAHVLSVRADRIEVHGEGAVVTEGVEPHARHRDVADPRVGRRAARGAGADEQARELDHRAGLAHGDGGVGGRLGPRQRRHGDAGHDRVAAAPFDALDQPRHHGPVRAVVGQQEHALAGSDREAAIEQIVEARPAARHARHSMGAESASAAYAA